MGTVVAADQSKVSVDSAEPVGDGAEWPVPKESTTSIYAAYWQARSGFFNEASKSPKPLPT